MNVLLKLALPGLVACSGLAFAAPNTPSQNPAAAISRGADYVSPPSAPERIFLDARTRPTVPNWRPGDPIREIPRQFHGQEELQRHPPQPVNPVTSHIDVLVELQRNFGGGTDGGGFTTPLVNLDGAPFTGVFPPDPDGDVGGGYFVAVYNGSGGALLTIYNTADGSVAAPQFSMDGLGSGGPCASGLGDGIVVFDHLAQRWLFTEFSGSSNTLCTYLSDGDNPVVTTWTRYTFNTPSFPDYPKYGVWTDAYYVGANEGPAVYALDRASMLAGLSATLQRKSVTRLNGLGFQMLPPASVFGTEAPPAGAPGIFIRDNDDERNNPGSNDPNEDYLELFTLTVDWATPTNTVLTGPIQVAEEEWDSDFNVTSGFGAIHQPGTSQTLDPLFEVPMVPVHYRNFGTYEVLVGNHVTRLPDDTTDNIAGVRWFELRRTGGPANPWELFQEGTYAPADAGGQISRWMAAIGMDESGNMAMAYSVARDPGVFPGLRYVGREATDPLGVMSTAETTLVDGGSSQNGVDRWGDYFGMGVDPVDGCTFWFTAMYMPPGGSWRMRFASFRFDTCGTPTFTTTGDNLVQGVCAATASPIAARSDHDRRESAQRVHRSGHDEFRAGPAARIQWQLHRQSGESAGHDRCESFGRQHRDARTDFDHVARQRERHRSRSRARRECRHRDRARAVADRAGERCDQRARATDVHMDARRAGFVVPDRDCDGRGFHQRDPVASRHRNNVPADREPAARHADFLARHGEQRLRLDDELGVLVLHAAGSRPVRHRFDDRSALHRRRRNRRQRLDARRGRRHRQLDDLGQPPVQRRLVVEGDRPVVDLRPAPDLAGHHAAERPQRTQPAVPALAVDRRQRRRPARTAASSRSLSTAPCSTRFRRTSSWSAATPAPCRAAAAIRSPAIRPGAVLRARTSRSSSICRRTPATTRSSASAWAATTRARAKAGTSTPSRRRVAARAARRI